MLRIGTLAGIVARGNPSERSTLLQIRRDAGFRRPAAIAVGLARLRRLTARRTSTKSVPGKDMESCDGRFGDEPLHRAERRSRGDAALLLRPVRLSGGGAAAVPVPRLVAVRAEWRPPDSTRHPPRPAAAGARRRAGPHGVYRQGSAGHRRDPEARRYRIRFAPPARRR